MYYCEITFLQHLFPKKVPIFAEILKLYERVKTLSKAAIIKGRKTPISKPINSLPITSPIDVFLKILPNAPPAPVISIIPPADSKALDTQLNFNFFDNVLGIVIAKMTPTSIAMFLEPCLDSKIVDAIKNWMCDDEEHNEEVKKTARMCSMM